MVNNQSSIINKQRIVFFGSGYYTIPIVEKLKEHELAMVVTTEPEGEFVDYLKKENVAYIYSRLEKEEDILKIKRIEPDLGILASYGAIIPIEILNLFPLGILNIHPSLLPKYKGPSPVQFTILNGDKKTGTTIIKLDEKVDHGPIIEQEEIELLGNETLKNLTEKLFDLGAHMIIKVIRKLKDGLSLRGKRQDYNRDIFTKKIIKEDGYIDFKNPPPPQEIERKIRAFYPWPTVWFRAKLNGKEKIIKLLPEEKIQVEGKKIMRFADLVNGYPEGKEILTKLSLA